MKVSGLLGLRGDFEFRPNLAGKGNGGRDGFRARALESDLVGGDYLGGISAGGRVSVERVSLWVVGFCSK